MATESSAVMTELIPSVAVENESNVLFAAPHPSDTKTSSFRSSDSGKNDDGGIVPNPTPGKVDLHYELQREIGRGFYGNVRMAKEKSTGKLYACKTMQKSHLKGRFAVIRREVDSLRHLSDDINITRLHAVYEDSTAVHLVVELCDGGDLCDEINRREVCFSERDAAPLFAQVALAIAKCHSKGVMHRDIKPENIFLSHVPGWNSDKKTQSTAQEGGGSPIPFIVKLGDFGQGVFLGRGEKMGGQCGSLYYLSPEMVAGKEYSHESDVWSLGILLWAMLAGRLPFSFSSQEKVQRAICRGKLNFGKDPWPSVSEVAKDLIRRMLTVDPLDRISAAEILEHPWVTQSVADFREGLAVGKFSGEGAETGRGRNDDSSNGKQTGGSTRLPVPRKLPARKVGKENLGFKIFGWNLARSPKFAARDSGRDADCSGGNMAGGQAETKKEAVVSSALSLPSPPTPHHHPLPTPPPPRASLNVHICRLPPCRPPLSVKPVDVSTTPSLDSHQYPSSLRRPTLTTCMSNSPETISHISGSSKSSSASSYMSDCHLDVESPCGQSRPPSHVPHISNDC